MRCLLVIHEGFLGQQLRPRSICTLNFFSIITIILNKQSERSEHSEVKDIKKGIKNFHPSVYGWAGMYLCVWPSEKVE